MFSKIENINQKFKKLNNFVFFFDSYISFNQVKPLKILPVLVYQNCFLKTRLEKLSDLPSGLRVDRLISFGFIINYRYDYNEKNLSLGLNRFWFSYLNNSNFITKLSKNEQDNLISLFSSFLTLRFLVVNNCLIISKLANSFLSRYNFLY